MRSFGKTISAVAGLSLLGMASANIAQGAPVTFSLNGGCAVDCGTDGPDGNTRTFTGSDGVTTVTAKAWGMTNNSANDRFETAFVGHYSNGLGVTNRDEGSGSSNRHTVDNGGSQEVIGFFFNDIVELTAVALSHYGDTDISVWIATVASMPDLTQTSLNNFDKLDDVFGDHFDNNGGSSSRTAEFGASAAFGNFMLISARVGHSDDKFKIKTLFANVDTPPGDVPGVAEPGTMLILGLGLAGLGYARRRKAA